MCSAATDRRRAPRRALSAFMFFGNEIQETIKRELPHLEFLQISAEIGRRWKSLTIEQRRPYEDMAAADKVRYLQEKEDSSSSVYSGRCDASNVVDARKQELLAYLAFCRETGDAVLAENPSKSMVEIAYLLADRYHAHVSSPLVSREATQPAASARSSTATSHSDVSAVAVAVTTDSPVAGLGTSPPSSASTPTRPYSPYVYFCHENRAKLCAGNPEKTPNEIIRLLAELWRALPDNERVKYQTMHVTAKTKYEIAMNFRTPIKMETKESEEDGEETETEEEAEESGDEKEETEKDQDQLSSRGRVSPTPKRAVSAFVYFCRDVRDVIRREQPQLEFLQVSAEIGRRWKSISAEDKQHYEKLAEEDKLRYRNEMEVVTRKRELHDDDMEARLSKRRKVDQLELP